MLKEEIASYIDRFSAYLAEVEGKPITTITAYTGDVRQMAVIFSEDSVIAGKTNCRPPKARRKRIREETSRQRNESIYSRKENQGGSVLLPLALRGRRSRSRVGVECVQVTESPEDSANTAVDYLNWRA